MGGCSGYQVGACRAPTGAYWALGEEEEGGACLDKGTAC